MKRVILFLFPVLVLVGCRTAEPTEPGRTKSIVILYENDVHCAIDGYTKLAGLRDAIAAADTAWVAVVSSGDFLQGGVAGALSEGQYIIDIMRHVGYTAITIGNHECPQRHPQRSVVITVTGYRLPVIEKTHLWVRFFCAFSCIYQKKAVSLQAQMK